ncbi:MAG: 16S rRNA (guanine(527)-N(7))-methyltransferase RsmG [Proteobacteria bacterium]|nr:16S rRNA (guanine(527)-N(7))-methyltransferase RsmG [Pseudomonadota bacterium]HQR03528.1 16S rRNA (guanine(527)-N(7))-methyltransferase RsmG [Rhodocyclaceae bacterium]
MTPAVGLHEGMVALGLDVSAATEQTEQKLLAYLALLGKWNRVYNLTAVRNPEDMVIQHLLDSLSLVPHLAGCASLVDVGSGAGLPGIPIAIAMPGLSISSVEAVQKKAAFQQQVKIELELGNFSVNGCRAEDLAGQYDAVTSRAFAELADFIRLAGHLMRPGGRLLAMKGQQPDEEIARLPAGWRVGECRPLVVPGLAARRHLIILEKT